MKLQLHLSLLFAFFAVTCSASFCGVDHIDLSPLRNNLTDYYLPANSSRDWDFYLNLCGRVVDTSHCPFPPGSTDPADPSGCQESDPGNKWAIGSAQTASYQKTPTGVVAYWTGGTDNGNGPRAYEIRFYCDASIPKGSPQFLAEYPPRYYIFQWNTSVVCSPPPTCSTPQGISLSPLRNSTYDYFVARAPWRITLNLCGPHISNQYCPSTPFSAACQYLSDSSSSLGDHRQAVYKDVQDGVLATFAGGDGGRTFQISFICDQSTFPGHPEFVSEGPPRNFNLVWKTRQACQITCSASFCGVDRIDLSPLRNNLTDYFLPASGSQPWDIYLNLCGSVVDASHCPIPPDSINPSDPSGCLESGPGNIWAMGSAQTASYQKTPTGVVAYWTGGTDSGRGPRSYEIRFYCDASIPKGSPQFLTEDPPRHYVLQWNTSVVCSPPPTCSTPQGISLFPLRNSTYDYFVARAPWKITLNLCGPLIFNQYCPSTPFSAACQYLGANGQYSLGDYRQAVYKDVQDGVLATFAGGDEGRTFQISFICDQSTFPGHPEFVSEGPPRNYNLVWKTRQACPKKEVCGAEGIDISPLRDNNNDYKIPAGAFGNPWDLYLNLCGKMVNPDQFCPVADPSSPDDPNMCIFVGLGSDWAVGSASSVQYTVNSQGLLASYTGGSDSGRGARSSQIQFICNPSAGKGSPQFISEDPPRHLNLKWETSYACKSSLHNHLLHPISLN